MDLTKMDMDKLLQLRKEYLEDMVRKELVEMLNKEEAEAPMEVIASLWVGGIAILALLSLVTLQASVFNSDLIAG